MKTLFLLLIAAFSLTLLTACQDDVYNAELNEPIPQTRHQSVFGDETPLIIYLPVEGLLEMTATKVGDFIVNTIIQNDSEWYIDTNFHYAVETYVNAKWLPVLMPDNVAFPDGIGPYIEPNDSLHLQINLPNLNPFPPPESLPLEAGRYRVRRTVVVTAGYSTSFSRIAPHDLVAEFYVP